MTAQFLGNVPGRRRCQARARASGERCKNPAANETRVCRMHGAGTLAAKAKAARNKAERRYATETERYVRQQPKQGLSGGPVALLELELQRSLELVRHLESVVAVLADDQLVWGLNEDDLRNAGVRTRDIPTILAQQCGRTHPAIELLHRERDHLTRLIGISLSNGVPEKQRAMDSAQVDLIQGAIEAILGGLGHSLRDPAVRLCVRDSLRSLRTH